MARTDPQLNFRIPFELKVELEHAAHAEGRSLNQELVRRLQQSFEVSAGTEELRREVGHLRLLAEERKRAVDLIAVLPRITAGIAQRILERLSEKERASPEVRVWIEFMQTVQAVDSLALVEELGPLMLGVPAEDVERLRTVRNQLAHSTPEHVVGGLEVTAAWRTAGAGAVSAPARTPRSAAAKPAKKAQRR